MSKYKIISIVCLSLLIGGCTQNIVSNVTFDEYSINISSKTATYSKYTGENITGVSYQIYTSQNTTGFSNSILISKNAIDTKIPLAKIAEINTRKVQEKLKGFASTSNSETSFTCKKQEIPAYLTSFTTQSINQKETLYTNQLFFIHAGYLYIISTSTENSTNSKELKTALKKIRCPEPTSTSNK